MLTVGHVPSSYRHRVKRAEPHGCLVSELGELKCYHIDRTDQPISDAVASEARAFLGELSREAGFGGDLGFSILHRCGAEFHFLLITVWRDANEGWEAVYYRDETTRRLTLFEPAYPPLTVPLRPTFCVWELGVVAHEARAWTRFLASPRLEADQTRWRDDLFSGDV